MSIQLRDYFGKFFDHPDATQERIDNATRFLPLVDALLERAADDGVPMHTNPNTGSQVSGQQYGGFRPQDCPQGSATSSHKIGRGVDIYDPFDELDDWLNDAILEEQGLYRENPDDTRHWCHLTDRAPGSKKRTFKP